MASIFPETLSDSVSRQGSRFVVTQASKLPPFCVQCGETATGEPVKKTFSWHSPWLYLMIVFPGLIFYVIVAFFASRKISLAIPLCENHRNRYRTGRLTGTVMMVGGISFAFIFFGISPENYGWAWLIGLGMLFAGAVVFAIADDIIRPSHIDHNSGTFRGANEAFLVRLATPTTTCERN